MANEIVPAGVSARIALFPSNRAGDPPENSIVHFRDGGAVKSINTVMMLQAPKHVAEVGQKKGDGGEWEPIYMISVSGWDKLNAAAGISVYMPETIIGDDGHPAPNPSKMYNHAGVLKRVRVKQIGIGRTRIGNIAARPYVIDLNLDDIFRRDLARKCCIKPSKKKPQMEAWGHLRPSSSDPAHDPGHVVYALPGDVDLVVDIGNPAVRAVIAAHQQTVQYAARIATAICRRKIIELFCPLPEPLLPVDGTTGTFAIPVVAWKDADRDMLKIGQWVEDAKSGDSFMVDGERLDVSMVAADGADPADVDLAIGDEEPLDADVPRVSSSERKTVDDGRTLPGHLAELRDAVAAEYKRRSDGDKDTRGSESNALWLLQLSAGFHDLDAAIVSNDFGNLRAALKALKSGEVGDADVADRSDGEE